MRIRRVAVSLLITGFLLLLTGCQSIVPERKAGEITLSGIKPGTNVPLSDSVIARNVQAVCYFPDESGGSLKPCVREVRADYGGRPDARELVGTLLQGPAAGEEGAYWPSVRTGRQTAEVLKSGDVVTVNLPVAYRALEPKQLYAVRRSIAETLLASGARYVSVLTGGREEGIDIGGLVPAGAFTDASEEISVLYERAEELRQDPVSFTGLVTMYLPSEDGKLLIPGVRRVAFETVSSVEYLYRILDEFGKAEKEALLHYPAPMSYVEEMPEIVRSDDGAYRVIHLNFSSSLRGALEECGLSLYIYMGMLTDTLMGYIPGLDGLQLSLGGKKISVLPAADTPTGSAVRFRDSLLTWDAFRSVIGAPLTLYQKGVRGGLRACRVYIPADTDEDARERLTSLFEAGGLSGALPAGLSGQDILAIRTEKSDIVLNLSGRVLEELLKLNEADFKTAVYAMTNTVTEGAAQQRVIFFFDGEQADGKGIVLRGKIVRNPGMIEQ